MRKRQIAKFCAWSLGFFVLCTIPACANNTSTPHQQEQQLNQQKILQELVKADVVYLGETHDNPEDHKAQLQILQALYQQKLEVAKDGSAPRIAIALEMFQRPYQNILDQYIAGKITEEQLLQQSDYEERWGFPWEYYAPILRFARANQLPILALNTPTEVTRKVARSGLESLTPAERKYIPPLSEIRTDNADYRQMVQTSYEQHHQSGHGNSNSFERFFTAQVLWDETMADAIAQFIKAHPKAQVMVLAGQTHIVYGYGIPSRVARRLNKHQLVQRSVLFEASPKEESSRKKTRADFFWQP